MPMRKVLSWRSNLQVRQIKGARGKKSGLGLAIVVETHGSKIMV
jgi:hypothetical protein